jgi:hypothetical protein
VARRAPSVQARTVYDELRAADPAGRVAVLAVARRARYSGM